MLSWFGVGEQSAKGIPRFLGLHRLERRGIMAPLSPLKVPQALCTTEHKGTTDWEAPGVSLQASVGFCNSSMNKL